jgi:hypothetical protein
MDRRAGKAEGGRLAPGYDGGHTLVMKTAISIPDPVFRAADRLAKRRRVSRSELYTRAIVALLKTEDDAEVTAQLDRAYADPVASTLPTELRALPAKVLDRDDW